MAELDKSKRREKMMEAELTKIYGDDWPVRNSLLVPFS
jgi:hypothetical protein